MRATDARLVMTEEYHKQFNINRNSSPDRLLSLVAMHRSEDPITGSLLEERMREFAELEIYKVFGCSWSEFLEQPRDECERMFEIARPRKEAENAVADAAANKLEKEMNKK